MDDEDNEDIVGMYELLAAVEEVIQAADPKKRAALAKTIDGLCRRPGWRRIPLGYRSPGADASAPSHDGDRCCMQAGISI